MTPVCMSTNNRLCAGRVTVSSSLSAITMFAVRFFAYCFFYFYYYFKKNNLIAQRVPV